MQSVYERGFASLVARIGENWRYGALAVIAYRALYVGRMEAGYWGDFPPEWAEVQAMVGQALRQARTEMGTNPVRTAPGTSLAALPAATASPTEYLGADAVYAIRERDVQGWILRDAIKALETVLKPLGKDQVDAALDALLPLMRKMVLKGILAPETPEQRRHAGWVADAVQRATVQNLAALGSVPGVKVSRMRPGSPLPTSGPASRAVVLNDPGSGRSWVVYSNRYARVPYLEALQTLAATNGHRPFRTRTTREELQDDRIADMRRPVRKPSRNSGKQKGRMGGPATIR